MSLYDQIKMSHPQHIQIEHIFPNFSKFNMLVAFEQVYFFENQQELLYVLVKIKNFLHDKQSCKFIMFGFLEIRDISETLSINQFLIT